MLTYNYMRQTIYIKHKYKKYNTIYTVHNQGFILLPLPTALPPFLQLGLKRIRKQDCCTPDRSSEVRCFKKDESGGDTEVSSQQGR